MPFERAPVDVLVLAAGGVVGEAWMTGVLRGLSDERSWDFRAVESFVGTSAGSIVAASLASGREPRGLASTPETVAEPMPSAPRSGLAAAAGTPAGRAIAGVAARGLGTLAGPSLAAGAPAGALARRAVLSRVPDGRRSLAQLRAEVERWGARFDGRLRICTLDRETGRRVVFGRPGAPETSVAEAVEASCAVPGVFRPVQIGGRTYVDGGVWSVTNLDVAPAARGTRVLCLTVTGGAIDASAAGLVRAATRPAVAVEAAALRRRGALVRVIGPDADLGADLLDSRGAGPAMEVGYRQGREAGVAKAWR